MRSTMLVSLKRKPTLGMLGAPRTAVLLTIVLLCTALLRSLLRNDWIADTLSSMVLSE